MILSNRQLSAVKTIVFIACLLPAASLGWGAYADTLGANPIEAITRGLGKWALSFLLITLTVTPARRYTGWAWLGRLRRMFGLYTFFYASLHVTSYLWFDQFFNWSDIANDLYKRPFITAGFIAFCLLLPLAATSSNAMIRRLGGRRWQELHRTIYAIAIISVVHFSWMVKKDMTQPLLYGIGFALLLGLRALWRNQEKEKQLSGAYLPKRKGKIIPIIAKDS
jgi:methionine sulfoxide reductase heme-binding subunit